MRITPLTALILAAVACGPARPDPIAGDKSILVVTLDTIRADHVGAYGHPLDLTPVLDGLAARGVLFETAYAPMPQTLPSHATLFTGLEPRRHGALENTYTLAAAVPTLAELARERGYDTAAFVGALALERATGIDQGFDLFDQPDGEWGDDKKGHPPQRAAREVTEAALVWAGAREGTRPFLLWVHYYDPHGDPGGGFLPPERFLAEVPKRDVRALVRERAQEFQGGGKSENELVDFWHGYAGEIRYTDHELGRLLTGLQGRGMLEDTVIVVAGDHGEGLYEHGVKAHGVQVWEEAHLVPLVLVHPDGVGAGTRVSGPATLADVAPTLTRLAMGLAPRGVSGLDLWAHVEATTALPERPVFLERPHFDRERAEWRLGGEQGEYGFLTAVVWGGHKLVKEPSGRVRLYDLVADPSETRDVSDERPEQRAELEGLLDTWMAANDVGLPGEGVEVSDERLENLKALGYIDG